MTSQSPAKTNQDRSLFDPDTPDDPLCHDRRIPEHLREVVPTTGHQPKSGSPPANRRRRRVDPTTFEKQYSPEEIEFMNAMQRFKLRTGKDFPTHRDVLQVVETLGYHRTKNLPKQADQSPSFR